MRTHLEIFQVSLLTNLINNLFIILGVSTCKARGGAQDQQNSRTAGNGISKCFLSVQKSCMFRICASQSGCMRGYTRLHVNREQQGNDTGRREFIWLLSGCTQVGVTPDVCRRRCSHAIQLLNRGGKQTNQ